MYLLLIAKVKMVCWVFSYETLDPILIMRKIDLKTFARVADIPFKTFAGPLAFEGFAILFLECYQNYFRWCLVSESVSPSG